MRRVLETYMVLVKKGPDLIKEDDGEILGRQIRKEDEDIEYNI